MAEKLPQEELNKIAAGDFGHYVENMKLDPKPEEAKEKEKRPVGRPKQMEWSRMVSVQIDLRTHAALEKLMCTYGISQSEAIRRAIRAGCSKLDQDLNKHPDLVPEDPGDAEKPKQINISKVSEIMRIR